MSETGNIDVSEILGSLSPYEVACLAFTSPKEINDIEGNLPSVVLTSKNAYLWAGAVAYVLTEKRELNQNDIIGFLQHAVHTHTEDLQRYSESIGTYGLGVRLVASFLNAAGYHDTQAILPNIIASTEQAIRRLEEQGLIEDPLTKKIGKFICSMLLVLPFNFTSVTDKGGDYNITIDALPYTLEIHRIGNQTDIGFKINIHKISGLLKNTIPETVDSASRK